MRRLTDAEVNHYIDVFSVGIRAALNELLEIGAFEDAPAIAQCMLTVLVDLTCEGFIVDSDGDEIAAKKLLIRGINDWFKNIGPGAAKSIRAFLFEEDEVH